MCEFLRHLLGALRLHLRAAWCRGPKHAGSNADGQVEGVHLVVVGVALDAVQHGDHMSQQQQVVAGQQVEQPVATEGKMKQGGGSEGENGNDHRSLTFWLLTLDVWVILFLTDLRLDRNFSANIFLLS